MNNPVHTPTFVEDIMRRSNIMNTDESRQQVWSQNLIFSSY